MLFLCVFFLRSREISVPSDQGYDAGPHLSYSDIAVDSTSNPTSMQVRIKSSKTDSFRKGIDLYVGPKFSLEGGKGAERPLPTTTKKKKKKKKKKERSHQTHSQST